MSCFAAYFLEIVEKFGVGLLITQGKLEHGPIAKLVVNCFDQSWLDPLKVEFAEFL
jgi:hypothetical protein